MVGIVGCVWLHKYTRKLGKYTRNGGEGRDYLFLYFFLSPSAHESVRNANEIGQIAKLYSEGNVFFSISGMHEGLDFGERGIVGEGSGATARTRMRIPI